MPEKPDTEGAGLGVGAGEAVIAGFWGAIEARGDESVETVVPVSVVVASEADDEGVAIVPGEAVVARGDA